MSRAPYARVKTKLRKDVIYDARTATASTLVRKEGTYTLQKRLSEHKAAVRRGDRKNGIAVKITTTAFTGKQQESLDKLLEEGTTRGDIHKSFADTANKTMVSGEGRSIRLPILQIGNGNLSVPTYRAMRKDLPPRSSSR